MVIDETVIVAILTTLTPIIALIITWVKKNLGYTQGDQTFTVLQNWVSEAQNLAISFPEIKPYSDELAEMVNYARLLWDNPADNSAELAQVYAHSAVLISKIYDLIKKYAPAS